MMIFKREAKGFLHVVDGNYDLITFAAVNSSLFT
jgi:hypothetical protein